MTNALLFPETAEAPPSAAPEQRPAPWNASPQVPAKPASPGFPGETEGPPPLPWMKDGQFLVSEAAEPPQRLLRQLLQLEPRFKQSWERSRPDFKEQTSHAYQISLAALAFAAGWNDQQVVNLIIAWRRRHNRQFQPRAAYYRSILAAGRQPGQRQRAQQELQDILSANDPERPEKLRHCLSRLLGCNINRILRYQGPPTVYNLLTDRGLVRLGVPANWQQQDKFQDAMQRQIGLRPATCLERHWQDRQQAISQAAETAQGQPPQGVADLTVQWLAGYLADFPPQTADWLQQAVQAKPFLKGHQKHVFSLPLRQWIADNNGPRLSPHEMGQRLRKLGAVPITIGFPAEMERQPDQPASRQCWRLPE